MRFSEVWLREWVDPPISSTELTDQLTMAGLEVDSVTPAAPPFGGVVVGEVIAVDPHPNADRLRVCQVDVGGDETLTIVCGAQNVHVGMRAPTALVGAELPGGMKIKQSKLRGVASFGMLCSAVELGLADQADGLMPLPADAGIGLDVRDLLGLDDLAIEVDLTPNRGDCLSVAGIAREVGVINRCALNAPDIPEVAASLPDTVNVSLEAPEDCPHYLCRVVRGVDAKASTPLWMVERLRRSGIRSLGPLVDVTNYVLLELGQPLHAFDLAKLQGGIRVRHASPGERLLLLNGQDVELTEGTLVIADQRRPLALAGIMGGEDSAVDEATRDILLESAFFDPTVIIGRARRYGLHTDSSHRFERGVDPALQRRALERASQLLTDIVGGQPGPIVEAGSARAHNAGVVVLLRRERVRKLLGVDIEDVEIEDILTRLGMAIEAHAQGWRVSPPTSRFDISLEVDLIEEIGRIYGYAALPTSKSLGGTALAAERPETAFDLHRAKQILVDRGYQEVVTYSFVSPAVQTLLDPGNPPLELANPISSEMSVMRTSVWPGLLQTLRYNQSRQATRAQIFEAGLRFIRQATEIKQEMVISGAVMGGRLTEQWGAGDQRFDFFDVKADVEALLSLTGCAGSFSFEPAEHSTLHPGQSARLVREGREVGWLGVLNPRLETDLEVAGPVMLFELRVAELGNGRLPAFSPLSRFPSIRRDIAVVVDRSVSCGQVLECVRESVPGILQDIILFDVYTGEKIDSGRKSLALGLILQDSSETLTDERVDETIGAVVLSLYEKLGGQLRE